MWAASGCVVYAGLPGAMSGHRCDRPIGLSNCRKPGQERIACCDPRPRCPRSLCSYARPWSPGTSEVEAALGGGGRGGGGMTRETRELRRCARHGGLGSWATWAIQAGQLIRRRRRRGFRWRPARGLCSLGPRVLPTNSMPVARHGSQPRGPRTALGNSGSAHPISRPPYKRATSLTAP